MPTTDATQLQTDLACPDETACVHNTYTYVFIFRVQREKAAYFSILLF